MKKFELTTDCITFLGRKLFRIRALIEFGDVKAGETGGYVEKEENLSQIGNAWVYGNAQVCGNARVYGDAQVYGDARVCGNARVQKEADYTTYKGGGSVYRTTTFFRLNSGDVGVKCGCFYGTLNEFREKIVKEYGDSLTADEYLSAAHTAELHFRRVGDGTDE